VLRMVAKDSKLTSSRSHNYEKTQIRKVKKDRQAFGELYEHYLQKIYTYVYYRTGNHADAEDLTSKVFQKAFTHMEGYKDQGLPFSAWLYRIAHNVVANWYRDQSRKKIVGLDEATRHSMEEEPDAAAEKNAESENLLRIIRKLPTDNQQLLILKFAEGCSNLEVGRILGRSEGAIKSLYHRTLIVLRDEMEKSQVTRQGKKGRKESKESEK
jgi:RNA polymerase sigma-70 factor (ECF subfamily)